VHYTPRLLPAFGHAPPAATICNRQSGLLQGSKLTGKVMHNPPYHYTTELVLRGPLCCIVLCITVMQTGQASSNMRMQASSLRAAQTNNVSAINIAIVSIESCTRTGICLHPHLYLSPSQPSPFKLKLGSFQYKFSQISNH